MKKIISVDDSRQIRMIVRGAVDVLGYEFIEAVDGLDGLRTIRANKDDLALVVLDVNMPGMLGTELLAALKGDPELKSIPVMMVTTESEGKLIIESVRKGAANYVVKPFDQSELIAKMVESMGEAA
ncbi:MAG: response regulator [Candidatus Hydrogenedens sp.]|nr:response regulator [Candidatus Hydrogenedens sp.]